jgi:SAM-dependent methyltransferase
MIVKKYEEIKSIYESIFIGLDGYKVSFAEKENREKKEDIFKDILYGEVSLELLYALFVLPPVNEYISDAKVFYDLGSGIGNAVISAYLTGAFKKCVGIELMNLLYETSLIAKKRMNESEGVFFINGNILNVDISEADIVLFCCPTKDENLRYKMEEKFKTLKKNSIILSLIHKFKDNDNFELLNFKDVKVAWGETPLFTYRKNN